MDNKTKTVTVSYQADDKFRRIRSTLERNELTRLAIADLTDEQLKTLIPQIISVGRVTGNKGNVAIGRNIVQIAQLITDFKEQTEMEKLTVLRQNLRDFHKNRWLPASPYKRLVISEFQSKIRWRRGNLERMGAVVPDDSIDTYSPPLLRSYIIGVLLLIAFLAGGLGYYFYEQAQPPSKIIILIANFDGPDPQKYRVSETVLERLDVAMKPYTDVEVIALGRAITQQEGSSVARSEGEDRKAAIVIWGWYGVTPEAVQLSVNFEILRSPAVNVQLGPDANGRPRTIELAKLDNFAMQTNLSGEMAYLSLFTVGTSRYSAGDWDGAISSFTDALNQTTEPVAALNQNAIYFCRGFAYSAEKAYDKAIGDFSQVIEASPDFAEAYRDRASTYLSSGSWDTQNYLIIPISNTIDEAISDYTSFIALKPNDTTGYESRGEAYIDKHDYNDAINDFQRVIDLEPQDTSGYIDQGSAYELRGELTYSSSDYDAAMRDYNHAIELEPNDGYNYLDRGNVYTDKADYTDALTDYNHYLEMMKSDKFAEHAGYYARGKMYYSMSNYTQAISDFNLADSLSPNDPALYSDRGLTYIGIGDYDKAISDINRAMALVPDQPEDYLNLGLAYYKMENYDQALLDANKSIELGETSGHAYAIRGLVYYEKGNYKNAVVDYMKALEIEQNDPNASEVYYHLGQAYFKETAYDYAIIALDKSINLRPDYLVAYVQRGEVYYYMKSYDLAIADCSTAIKLKPDAEIFLLRGLAYEESGKTKQAIADFITSLILSKDDQIRQEAREQLSSLGVNVATPTPNHKLC